MTPAVNNAKKAKIPFKLHQYDHDPSAGPYGEEAASKLGISMDRVFKTLVVSTDGGRLAVSLVPVSAQLNLKRFSSALGVKKSKMATPREVERSTGYVLGGVSPLGQKKKLKTVIDRSAENHETIYVSAGRRGVEIELAPKDLATIIGATFAPITQ